MDTKGRSSGNIQQEVQIITVSIRGCVTISIGYTSGFMTLRLNWQSSWLA
jgi:hypothetical protein